MQLDVAEAHVRMERGNRCKRGGSKEVKRKIQESPSARTRRHSPCIPGRSNPARARRHFSVNHSGDGRRRNARHARHLPLGAS